jgi:hypothetical protein
MQQDIERARRWRSAVQLIVVVTLAAAITATVLL